MEGVAVKILAIFRGPEFVGGGAGFVSTFASVFGELVDELAELLGVDVEVALGSVDEIFFDGGFHVKEFTFVGVEPVVGESGFTPKVEDVVVDGDAEFFVGCGEVEALGEGVFEGGAVVGDGVGDGAEGLGSSFVVGFEFGDEEE